MVANKRVSFELVNYIADIISRKRLLLGRCRCDYDGTNQLTLRVFVFIEDRVPLLLFYLSIFLAG